METDTYSFRQICDEYFEELKKKEPHPNKNPDDFYRECDRKLKDVFDIFKVSQFTDYLKSKNEYVFFEKEKDFIKLCLAEHKGKLIPYRRSISEIEPCQIDYIFLDSFITRIIKMFQSRIGDEDILNEICRNIDERFPLQSIKNTASLMKLKNCLAHFLNQKRGELCFPIIADEIERQFIYELSGSLRALMKKWGDVFDEAENIIEEEREIEIEQILAKVDNDTVYREEIDFCLINEYSEAVEKDQVLISLNSELEKHKRQLPKEGQKSKHDEKINALTKKIHNRRKEIEESVRTKFFETGRFPQLPEHGTGYSIDPKEIVERAKANLSKNDSENLV